MHLKSIDQSWVMENALIDMITGEGAEKYAESRLLKCLPSQVVALTVDESIAKLEKAIT